MNNEWNTKKVSDGLQNMLYVHTHTVCLVCLSHLHLFWSFGFYQPVSKAASQSVSQPVSVTQTISQTLKECHKKANIQ